MFFNIVFDSPYDCSRFSLSVNGTSVLDINGPHCRHVLQAHLHSLTPSYSRPNELSIRADLKFSGSSRILGTSVIGLVGSRLFLTLSALMVLGIYGAAAFFYCIRYIWSMTYWVYWLSRMGRGCCFSALLIPLKTRTFQRMFRLRL